MDAVFVSIEGVDGCGKSTFSRGLKRALEEQGRDVLLTREPGGSEMGTKVREIVLHTEGVSPQASALLFAADRAEHVRKVIASALAKGQVVLTDRFTDSTIVYQSVLGGLNVTELEQLNRFATGGLVPNVTFLLDLTVTQLGERWGRMMRSGRKVDSIESGLPVKEIREEFLELASREPRRFVVLDGSRSPEQLVKMAMERLGNSE